MTTPAAMAGRAVRMRISSTSATSAPVHAPVPGRGMATSSTSPSVRYFRTFRPFKCARRSRRSTFGPSHALFRIRANTRRSSSKMQGTGVRFPAIAVTAATAGGSPAATPSGMAPRSSTTGTIAMKKVIASFPNTLSPKIMYVPSRAEIGALFLFYAPSSRTRPCRPQKSARHRRSAAPTGPRPAPLGKSCFLG